MIGEDYILTMLRMFYGASFDSNRARENQYRHGENAFGLELKFDIQSERYPNLYIESYRRDNHNQEFWKSSLLKDDGSWLWCQFNRNECWFFMKENLRRIYDHRVELGYTERQLKSTSMGFLLPKKDIYENPRIYCQHIVFSEEEKRMVSSQVYMPEGLWK